jgi:maltose/moltooligosaccharide transporter
MKLNYGRTFLLGLGFLGVNAIWAIYGQFVPSFLEKKFHLAPIFLAFFMTLDNIASLLIQPPIGAWSDKLRTPIGRRMPFIMVGAPVAALAFLFIPVAPVLPLFVVCTMSLLISMAFWRTPAVALIADVTPSPLRSQASAVISVMGGLGGVIALAGGAALFKFNPAYPFWFGSVIVVVSAALLLIFVREPKVYDAEVVEVDKSAPNFWQTLVSVCRDRSVLYMLLSTFFLMLSYTAIEGTFPLFASNRLGLTEGQSAGLMAQLIFVFMIFALPSGYLGARIGRKSTVSFGLLAMAVVFFAIFVTSPALLKRPVFWISNGFSVSLLALLLMVAGVCWALIIVHLLPMLSDMTDGSQIGAYTGLYYFVTSLAAIAGPLLNGGLVQVTGNYNAVMLLSSITLVVAFALMLCVHRGESVSKLKE